MELRNPSTEGQQVVVTFEHATGTKVGHVELKVPAEVPRWRTWAKTARVNKSGDWDAVVSSPEGVELARTPFVVPG
jgi:hypothetical protein